MVSEKQNLSTSCKHSERLEGSLYANVVKLNQNIIHNNRDRRSALKMTLNRREA